MRITLAAVIATVALVATNAEAQTAKVRYEIVAPVNLVATPAANAKIVVAVDSGTVIQVAGPEELLPTHLRVTLSSGESGWIENAAVRRVVTLVDAPVRLGDTVRVVRVDTVIRVDTVRLDRARKP